MPKTEARPTLLCIPDISGFTHFMTKIDFNLSSTVIPTLLNSVIYSNKIDLKVSEIEGDAVLFFCQDRFPDAKSLIEQCKNFYLEFYRKMIELQQTYENRESAKMIPDILGLKIILHYGEIATMPIEKHIKLMGKEVIAAHSLLKNDIPIDEYLLVSEQLLERYSDNDIEDTIDWGALKKGHIEREHLGKIQYRYVDFKALQATID